LILDLIIVTKYLWGVKLQFIFLYCIKKTKYFNKEVFFLHFLARKYKIQLD